MRYLALFATFLAAFLLLECCGIQTGGERSANTSKETAQDSAKAAQVAQSAPGTGADQVATANGGSQVPATAPKKEPQTEAEEEAAQAAGGGGWDAEDLRARRSAQAMLDAEKRLKNMLKAGKIKGLDRILPFEEISSWPYQDGLKGMPKRIKKLDGKQVLMTGFMLPIDEVENIKEFLLVQSLWGCCYGTPPDINGVVRVVMKGSKRIDYEFEPIKVIGAFSVGPTIEDGFCVDIYQLSARLVEVIK